jgi:trans-2,3-dihydro-3-hydroxyanthranilate isomerase
MASSYRYVLADVFTDTPLLGNQLAVFTDARSLADEQMQALAAELNLSETVFILPPEDDGDVRLRIFTPTTELPFAGHPVLGSAFVLGAPLQRTVIRLETGVGTIAVELEREGDRIVFGRMEQRVPTWEPCEREEELLAALGVEHSELPVEIYENGPRHAYVALAGEEAVASLRPDMAALAGFELSANCFAGEGTHWKTRVFLPYYGIDEDPAAGSAAGPLAVHLARHGQIAFGEQIEIRQGAELGRPSTLFARAEGSAGTITRVEVGGAAVVVARGEFKL